MEHASEEQEKKSKYRENSSRRNRRVNFVSFKIKFTHIMSEIGNQVTAK